MKSPSLGATRSIAGSRAGAWQRSISRATFGTASTWPSRHCAKGPSLAFFGLFRYFFGTTKLAFRATAGP